MIPNADVDVAEAWQITTGDPEMVIGVIDDGFDLGHPELQGAAASVPVRLPGRGPGAAPGQRRLSRHAGRKHRSGSHRRQRHARHRARLHVPADADRVRTERLADRHPRGLPLRLPQADVVNCSFGPRPRSFDPFGRAFRKAMTELAEIGGRRRNGLVFVFCAANDDAPTFLDGTQNRNGVRFSRRASIAKIPAGRAVFSGYPMTPGLIVVAAMSSRKRKAGYSCWGPHVTVTAPSNNMHYIPAFTRPGTPGRDAFVADYRGRGQVGPSTGPASARPSAGSPNSTIPPRRTAREHVHPGVRGHERRRAHRHRRRCLMIAVDPTSAPPRRADPDVHGRPGSRSGARSRQRSERAGPFGRVHHGRSLLFGAGKINAARAVARARALNPTCRYPVRPGASSARSDPISPNADSRTAGVVSEIECPIAGRLSAISVAVAASPTPIGAICGSCFRARVAWWPSSSRSIVGIRAMNVRTYTPATTADLARMVQAGVEVSGRWRLNVADHLSRDVGRFTSWELDLRVA